MEEQVFKATVREAVGTSVTRKLRRAGKVPGVLYGHGEETVSLAVSAEDVRQMVESGHHLVVLEVNGRRDRAIIRDMQWDTWNRDVLHMDFGRVALDETVSVAVPVLSHGTPKAVLSGAVLEQPLHSVEVSCKADHIPDEIVVEVGDMEPGDMIRVKDIPVPAGVTVAADAETIVFILEAPREEAEIEEEVIEPQAEEPEVIGRRKEGEEEEAAKK